MGGVDTEVLPELTSLNNHTFGTFSWSKILFWAFHNFLQTIRPAFKTFSVGQKKDHREEILHLLMVSRCLSQTIQIILNSFTWLLFNRIQILSIAKPVGIWHTEYSKTHSVHFHTNTNKNVSVEIPDGMLFYLPTCVVWVTPQTKI